VRWQLFCGLSCCVGKSGLGLKLGHKNIMHTVCYTELSLDRFKGIWED
jgi:hypothetical protein